MQLDFLNALTDLRSLSQTLSQSKVVLLGSFHLCFKLTDDASEVFLLLLAI